MAVEDITSINEKEPNDFIAIPPSKTDLVEEDHFYADRNGNENTVRDESEIRVSVSQCNIPSGKIENTNSYNDNNVIQCELPELMGYSEKDCNVVEESESGNGNGLCTVLPFEENQNNYVTKEREDSELLSSHGSKSSSEGIQEWGTKEEIDMEMLLSDALELLLENHLVDDIDNDDVSLDLMQTGEANYTTTDKIEDVPREKSIKSLFESDGYEVERQSGQIPCSEAESEAPSLVSTTEGGARKSSSVNDLSYNRKVDSATITFDFNSSKSTASNGDEHSDAVAPLKIHNNRARHEDGVSAVGSEIQGQAESSFSNFGPMTQSGSVSLRSDSSTTSARSFAFPTIQSEWISSPIRMAKADTRHYKKHRCWMEGVLCCRF